MNLNYLKAIFLTLGLAFFANALWLIEITRFIGWEGMEWVSSLHYSVFVIALLAVVAYVLPFRFVRQVSWAQAGQATLEMYPATLVAFFLAKTLLFSLYMQLYGYLNRNLMLLVLGLVVVLISFSIHFVTQKSLHRVHWVHGLFVAAGIMMVVPLSTMTVRFLPSNGVTFIDAVKMGFSYFWIVLMMGVLGIRTASWKPKSDVNPAQDNILDDLPED